MDNTSVERKMEFGSKQNVLCVFLHSVRIFGMRQEADYEDFHSIEKEDIEPLIPKIRSLINEIEEIIKEEK